MSDSEPSQRATAITHELLDQTSRNARKSPRQRMNFNFHQPEDTVQRFLNAIEPESYIRPHRHVNPPRDEVFLVLRGRGAVILFSETGDIDVIHLLDASLGCWGIDIKGGVFHTIVSTQPDSVFYEIKPGPYDPKADKGFSPWSPSENSIESSRYLMRLHLAIEHQQKMDA